ncbi:Pup--protein ligase [Auritidibacter ignavus]|uniref:Pup--protein ligase n=1 Tax=Auritidibacter ignavus TaxID=678932 RepID=A0AAJ6DDD5_9MICC|nr:Pup--protein ligase [Auritidibacter ignavus]WGH93717.1 Pup--protein ligase [Auritidibacter ignavus]
MDHRAFGVETEYGVHYVPSGIDPRTGSPTGRLNPEDVARYLFRPVVSWGGSSNVFISNGSRLYLDVGSHPEYATAECSLPSELIASDKAGERIFGELAHRAEAALAEDGFSGTIYLYRNNADSQGNAFGSHENYTITRSLRFRRLTDALIPFLVTRQLMTGSGVVIPDPSQLPEQARFPVNPEPHFAFSQRADYVQEGVSSSSTRARPIINTRDEPHADAAVHRRLHVIVGDSNMSETTQLLRLATTDLMLRILEAGVPLPQLQLAHPVRAIRQVSHDLTGTEQLDLAEGGTRSALEIQWEILALAQHFIQRHGAHHDELSAAMQLWERTLEAVEAQDFSRIDTEIDWAIKFRFINRYCEKKGYGLDHPRVKQLDLSYHDINPDRSLFYLLQSRNAARRVLTDQDITHATEHPPKTTRASIRGRFIRAARDAGMGYAVDWTHLKLVDFPLHTVHTKGPLDTDSSQVDELLARAGLEG